MRNLERLQAKATKSRERAEANKWLKEIQTEKARRQKLRDVSEEKGWRGSKKFGQIRRKFERVLQKLPTFNVVKHFQIIMQNLHRISTRTRSTCMVVQVPLLCLKKPWT